MALILIKSYQFPAPSEACAHVESGLNSLVLNNQSKPPTEFRQGHRCSHAGRPSEASGAGGASPFFKQRSASHGSQLKRWLTFMWEMRAGRSQPIRRKRRLVRLVVTAVPREARFKEVNMIQYNSFISLMKVITARWGRKKKQPARWLSAPTYRLLQLH